MTQSIDKHLELDVAQDYAELREQGLQYVRALAGDIWTDHNIHDPGITTLEILCYAITDLGYRTSFPTEDLLAGQNGFIAEPERSGFFPAQQSLTTTPLTQSDYRKLLLKISGIRNAWIQPRLAAPGSEIEVYADLLEGKLSFDATNDDGDANGLLHINGLYDVLLELEPDAALGSMNDSALPLELRQAPFDGVTGQLNLLDNTATSREVWAEFTLPEDLTTLTWSLSESQPKGVTIALSNASQSLPVLQLILSDAQPGTPADSVWLALLQNPLTSPLYDFALKQRRIVDMLNKAQCALDENRNLCEDYASVDTVSADYIAVCADIEVTPGADLEQVQAEVYFAIEQYLNPPVAYYSLSELLADGIDPSDIYEGPYIDHALQLNGETLFSKAGFVRDDELLASELRDAVYSSDIINVVMDIPDVVNVKSLLLRKYHADGTPASESDKWCVPVLSAHQPVLMLSKCKILFFKQGVPFVAREMEFEATLRHLRASSIKQAYTGVEETLTLPVGQKRDTLTHYPVQHDFPETYQIGEAGLKANASIQRINQARQFKSYLMCFEQVLADYLAQLANLPELFSLDTGVKQTYFSQYLDSIAGSTDNFADEYYQDSSLFSDPVRRNGLRETREAMQDRRNRLLDHLLARFAESFTDYVMMMLQHQGKTPKTQDELIADKIAFLRQQPVLSRERNRAFNYRPEDMARIWQSNNVSGLEKRACRLAGIDNINRRDLSCQRFMDTLLDTRQTGNEFRVEIKDAEQYLLFKSYQLFIDRDSAMHVARQIYSGVRLDSSYQIERNSDGKYLWYLRANGQELQQDKRFDTEADARADISEVMRRVDEVPAETENGLPLTSLRHPANILFDTRKYGRDHCVEIKDPGQNILFKSREIVETRAQARQLAAKVFPAVRQLEHYYIDDSGGPGAVYFTLSSNGTTLTHSELFDNRNAARARIDAIIARYYEVLESEVCNDEGLYLIEHLLLRPRTASAELPSVCLDPHNIACTDEDPFSFKASVILPYWPRRFQDMAFRKFFEDLLREQAPAHVHLKICWIDYHQMVELEQALQAWLQALATEAFNSILLTQSQNRLIAILGQLRSIHPAATLHDCDDDESGEPVRLGSTNLGNG